MDKITQKKNEKYLNIIASAFELFEAKGMQAVSIDDIVKKAGIAKGTFYLYFTDKFDLVTKLIIKKAIEYMKKYPALSYFSDEADFREFISPSIDFIIGFLLENKTLTMLIDKNVHICVNAVIEHREGLLEELYEKICLHFINKGFSEEEFRIKFYLFSELIVSACCNAIIREYPYTLDEIKPNLFDIISKSLYNIEEKGKKVE